MLCEIVASRERRGRRYVGGRLPVVIWGVWRNVERRARPNMFVEKSKISIKRLRVYSRRQCFRKDCVVVLLLLMRSLSSGLKARNENRWARLFDTKLCQDLSLQILSRFNPPLPQISTISHCHNSVMPSIAFYVGVCSPGFSFECQIAPAQGFAIAFWFFQKRKEARFSPYL